MAHLLVCLDARDDGRRGVIGGEAESGGEDTRRWRVLVREGRREGANRLHGFKVKLARGLG